MARSVSKEHADAFLARERQALEELRAHLGSEAVDKMGLTLRRDLIYERKEADLADLFDVPAASSSHEIMVMARSARAQRRDPRPAGPRERRRQLVAMQRSGTLALKRLEEGVNDREGEVTARYWINHSVVARVSTESVGHLAARQDVDNLTAVKTVLADCMDVSRPLIQADQVANNLGFDGTGITVAVLDTGIDTAHPALAGVVTAQFDMTGEGVGDLNGHGSHTAGSVASQDRVFRGIAPGASLVDIKILDAFGSTDQNIAVAGMQQLLQVRAQVASNSWGFSHANGNWVDTNGTCVLCVAADAAIAAGIAFVVAAGNEDNDSCATYDTHIRCPGMARSVITIGASDDSDNMADFSSIGPTPDGRPKPDLVAPGVGIMSCRAGATDFVSFDGTSMATPQVAGMVALMLDKNGTLTPAQVLGILTTTAVNIGAAPEEMGAGRVDALAAVNAS